MKLTALIAIISDSDEEKSIAVSQRSGVGSVAIIHGKNIASDHDRYHRRTDG